MTSGVFMLVYIRHLSEQTMCILLLPPGTKLGQGYIFTGVCDSVHRRGGGLVWLGGGMCGRGGYAWLGEGACMAGGEGACMAGGHAWLGRGHVVAVATPNVKLLSLIIT